MVGVPEAEGSPDGRTRFTGWQWIELWALIVLIAVQLTLQLVHARVPSLLVGLAVLAVVIHCYTWLIALRRRQRAESRS